MKENGNKSVIKLENKAVAEHISCKGWLMLYVKEFETLLFYSVRYSKCMITIPEIRCVINKKYDIAKK